MRIAAFVFLIAQLPTVFATTTDWDYPAQVTEGFRATFEADWNHHALLKTIVPADPYALTYDQESTSNAHSEIMSAVLYTENLSEAERHQTESLAANLFNTNIKRYADFHETKLLPIRTAQETLADRLSPHRIIDLTPEMFEDQCDDIRLISAEMITSNQAFLSSCNSIDAYLNQLISDRLESSDDVERFRGYYFIRFHPGTYRFFNPVAVSTRTLFFGLQDGVQIRNGRMGSQLDGDKRNRSVFVVNDAAHIGVENLNFRDANIGVLVESGQLIQLRNLTIENRTRFLFEQVNNLLIEHNRFYDSQNDSFLVFNSSDVFPSRNLYIGRNLFGGIHNEAIDLNGKVEDVMIYGNHFLGNVIRDSSMQSHYAEEIIDIGNSVNDGVDPIRYVHLHKNYFDCFGRYSSAVRIKENTSLVRLTLNHFNDCSRSFTENEYSIANSSAEIIASSSRADIATLDAHMILLDRNIHFSSSYVYALARFHDSSSNIALVENSFNHVRNVIFEPISSVHFLNNLVYKGNLVSFESNNFPVVNRSHLTPLSSVNIWFSQNQCRYQDSFPTIGFEALLPSHVEYYPLCD